MNPREFTSLVLLTIFYVLLQTQFLRHIVLFDVAFCFLYIACVLLLPFETNVSVVLLFSFVLGIIVDWFYNTAGIHAAATVLIGYLRLPVLKAVKGLDNDITISLKSMGFLSFLQYAGTLALIHHFTLFLIEANNSQLFLYSLLKSIMSAIFTCLIIVLLQTFRK